MTADVGDVLWGVGGRAETRKVHQKLDDQAFFIPDFPVGLAATNRGSNHHNFPIYGTNAGNSPSRLQQH